MTWRERVAGAVALAALAAAFAVAATGFAPTRAGEPERSIEGPLCCGVPPADEVTADHVFGRWVVMRGGIGAPLQPGQRIEFRRDGTLAIGDRACRFAILRAELTIACVNATTGEASSARRDTRGDLRFVDDSKLIWRIDGRSSVYIAPAD